MVTRPMPRCQLLVFMFLALTFTTTAAASSPHASGTAFLLVNTNKPRRCSSSATTTRLSCATLSRPSRATVRAPVTEDDHLHLTSMDFRADALNRLNDLFTAVENRAQGAPLAAFDADGTLWETDACLEYMHEMDRKMAWNQCDTVATYEALLKAVGKERAYGYCAQLFEGLPLDLIERTCSESYQANVKRTVFPEMRKLVAALKRRGWQVAVVTASPTWVVVPGAVDLGLSEEDVIGIDVEVSGGRATNKLKLPLSYGPGKPQRLRMVHSASSRPLSLAAGNSRDDFDLLEEVEDGGIPLFVDSRSIRGTGEIVGEALSRSFLVHTPRSIVGRAHRL